METSSQMKALQQRHSDVANTGVGVGEVLSNLKPPGQDGTSEDGRRWGSSQDDLVGIIMGGTERKQEARCRKETLEPCDNLTHAHGGDTAPGPSVQVRPAGGREMRGTLTAE